MCLPYRITRKVMKRLGRRGAFLMAMGIAWVGLGYSILSVPAPPAQTTGLTIILAALPLHMWGWVWITAGTLGIAHSGVQDVGRDQVGFTALALPTAAWSAGYLADWLAFGGYSRGWVTSLVYAALCASIVIAAGWPEVRRS